MKMMRIVMVMIVILMMIMIIRIPMRNVPAVDTGEHDKLPKDAYARAQRLSLVFKSSMTTGIGVSQLYFNSNSKLWLP